MALQAAATVADTTTDQVAMANLDDVIRADEQVAMVAVTEAAAWGASQEVAAAAPVTVRGRSSYRSSRPAVGAVAAEAVPASYKEAVASKIGEKGEQTESEDLVRCTCAVKVLHIGFPRSFLQLFKAVKVAPAYCVRNGCPI